MLQHVALLLSSFQVLVHTPCIRNHFESIQVAIFEDNFQDSAVCPWCARVKMNAAASVQIQMWEPFGSSWHFLRYISIMTDEVSEGVAASLMLFWAAHCFAMFCQTFEISSKYQIRFHWRLPWKSNCLYKCYVNNPEFAAWCCMHFHPNETSRNRPAQLQEFESLHLVDWHIHPWQPEVSHGLKPCFTNKWLHERFWNL